MEKKEVRTIYKKKSLISFQDKFDDDDDEEYESEQIEFPQQRSVSATIANIYETSSKNRYELPPMQAIAAAIVLEDAADELAILGKMGDLPNAEADLNYKTLTERFAYNTGGDQIFDPDTIEPMEVFLDKQKFIKFQQDRSFVEKILRETVRDLTTKHHYKPLVKHLANYDKRVLEESLLLDQEIRNKTKINELETLLDTERREAQSKIQECAELIGQLKDGFEDQIFENKIKGDYIENWENARTEQNNYRLDKEEEHYLNIINTTKADIEREIRIDAEIESYITQCQKDYEDGIQYWMERYDREIEIRDTEIQVLKEKREEQFNRIRELSQLYNQHRIEMKAYLKVKELRRQAEELERKRNQAAIRIQAWWRGLMVRRCLGRFSKKKPGKDKKKGKK